MEPIVFYILAAITVVTALLMVTRTSPISSAVWLIACFFAFAGLFVLLEAHFIAVIQVLLYAGAIMVLFVFVIMLLNLRPEELKTRAIRFQTVLGGIFVLYLVFLLPLSLFRSGKLLFPEVLPQFGYVQGIAEMIFTKYLVPFEVTSVLLLVAIVGSVIMGKRKL